MDTLSFLIVILSNRRDDKPNLTIKIYLILFLGWRVIVSGNPEQDVCHT